MLRNIWSILCENIIQDSISNKESYIFAIENGEFNEYPAKMPNFCLATFWEKTVDYEINYKLRLSLTDYYYEKIADILETDEVTVKKKRSHFNFVNLGGYNIPNPGEYYINIESSVNDNDWYLSVIIPVSFRKTQKK